MHRAGLLVAAAALVAALVAASTAQASKFIQKGIYDDAQVLYGNPDKVFPTLRQLGTKLVRVNLWWGGPNGVATRKPANPANPNDPAYRWDTYDRTVRYAQAYGMQPIFTVIGTPSWANPAGWNTRPIEDLRSAVVRHGCGASLLGHDKGRRRDADRPRFEMDRLERAEQSGLPQAPVRSIGRQMGHAEPQGLRPDLQRGRKGDEVGQPVQQGRLRCYLPAGEQSAGNPTLIRVAARLPEGDEERRRNRIRCLCPPPVLWLSDRDAV